MKKAKIILKILQVVLSVACIIKTRLLEFVGVIVSTSIGLIGQILLSNFYDYLEDTYMFVMLFLIFGTDFVIFRHCIKKYKLFTEEYKEKSISGYYILKLQYHFVRIISIISLILGIIWLFKDGIGEKI